MSTHAIKNENRPNPRTATPEKKRPFSLSGDDSWGNNGSDGMKNLVKGGGLRSRLTTPQ